MNHTSKLEGRNKVRVATAFRRIVGVRNFKNYTKVGEITFTAESVLYQNTLDTAKVGHIVRKFHRRKPPESLLSYPNIILLLRNCDLGHLE
jgi:hypothetical protein